jgi:predicted transcriptional regulator
MFDKSDFIVGKRYKKKYKSYCNECKKDRGYLTEDGEGLCYSCAIVKRNNKIGTPLNIEKIRINNITKYKTNCNECGKDRGFVRSCDIDKKCNKCANIDSRKNKPKDLGKVLHSKLRHVMRSSISRRMKQRGSSKNRKSVIDILGYTFEQLKTHLESRFEPGMTWENYGQWEIDHIIPDSWFNYSSTDDEDFKKSWALGNLQPMWAASNRKKSNKYSGSRQDKT